MGWRRGEVWFEIEVLWFNEQPQPAFAFAGAAPAALGRPIPNGLVASRLRRAAKRHKRRSRRVGAAALVVGSTAVIPLAVHRYGSSTIPAKPLAEDPPSLSFRLGPVGREVASAASVAAAQKPRGLVRSDAEIDWRAGTSRGLPFGGSLSGGTQLPQEGPDWVTWDPVTDSVPNEPVRLYGNEHTIRTVVKVLAAYRKADPDAGRVVVGDISFRGGGPMEEHVSHQNGLDVDVYYPRRDRALRAPVVTSQVDRARAQDLLDRFVAAGAQMVFVGFSTGLHGPSGVVIPYPNHENHMHVRFPPPR
jgi:penicillin-insensitive murein endopeptidase